MLSVFCVDQVNHHALPTCGLDYPAQQPVGSVQGSRKVTDPRRKTNSQNIKTKWKHDRSSLIFTGLGIDGLTPVANTAVASHGICKGQICFSRMNKSIWEKTEMRVIPFE